MSKTGKVFSNIVSIFVLAETAVAKLRIILCEPPRQRQRLHAFMKLAESRNILSATNLTTAVRSIISAASLAGEVTSL